MRAHPSVIISFQMSTVQQPGLPGVVVSTAAPGAVLPSSQPQWAAWYGVGERTLKRWVATGRSAWEKCPFTEPEELILWLARHTQRQPNDGIVEKIVDGGRRLKAARENPPSAIAAPASATAATGTATPPRAVPSPAATDSAPCQAPEKIALSNITPIFENSAAPKNSALPADEMDFEQLLRAARMRTASLFRRITAAESAEQIDEGLVATLENQFNKAMGTMRQLELAAQEVLADSGKYARLADVTASVAKIHGSIVTEFYALQQRYEAAAAGKLEFERRAIWRRLFNEVLSNLHANRFASGLTLPPEDKAA